MKIHNGPVIKINISVYILSIGTTVRNRKPPDGPKEGTTYRFTD